MQCQRALFQHFGVRRSAIIRIIFKSGYIENFIATAIQTVQRAIEEFNIGLQFFNGTIRARNVDQTPVEPFFYARQNERAGASGKSAVIVETN